MHPLLVARARAYLRDAGTYLAVAGATVPLGLLLRHRGLAQEPCLVLVVSAVPPLVATVLAGWQEAGLQAATPGKRREGLVVSTTTDEPLTVARALLRNTVKVAIPWQLGHLVAIGAAYGGFGRGNKLTLTATAVTYPLVAMMIVSVARGTGRGLHDWLAATTVRRV